VLLFWAAALHRRPVQCCVHVNLPWYGRVGHNVDWLP
jgi:hypothetical protein